MSLLAPMLAFLLTRRGVSRRRIAAAVGISHVAIGERLAGRPSLSLQRTLDVARACGATPEELHRVRVLDALDRGALPLPNGVNADVVAAAMAVLEAAS
jgi:transcriptional regulator with XRE-family HTH domain